MIRQRTSHSPADERNASLNAFDEARKAGETAVPYDDRQDSLPLSPTNIPNLDVDRELAAKAAGSMAYIDELDRRDVVETSAQATHHATIHTGEHQDPRDGHARKLALEYNENQKQLHAVARTPGASQGDFERRIAQTASLLIAVGDGFVQSYLWTRNGVPAWQAIPMTAVTAGTIVFTGKLWGRTIAKNEMFTKNGPKPPGGEVATAEFYGTPDPRIDRTPRRLALAVACLLPLALTMWATGSGDPVHFGLGLSLLTAIGIFGTTAATAYGYNPVRDKQLTLEEGRRKLIDERRQIDLHAADAAANNVRADLGNKISTVRRQATHQITALLVHRAKSNQPNIYGYEASESSKNLAGIDADGRLTHPRYLDELTLDIPAVDLAIRTIADPDDDQGRLFSVPDAA